jgi:cbb3-type cytochrome oxidase subunit 1
MLYILARSVTRKPLSYFCTISFFYLIVIAFFTFSSFLSLFSSFFGVILIAISKINCIKHCTDWNYIHKYAYLGSD